MTTEPLVSVVIPTFNRAGTIRRAIDSALEQTYSNIEVVISDNASTDGSSEIFDEFESNESLRVIRHTRNLGPIANWRAAVEASRGDYVKIVWSDDWMEANTVAALMRPLLADKAVGFAMCPQVIHLPGRSMRLGERDERSIGLSDVVDARLGLQQLPVSPGAGVVSREDALWAVASSFNERFGVCCDKAIGADALMLFGALRRGEVGQFVVDTVVHFEGGYDSITMLEDKRTLSFCYSMAFAHLLASCDGSQAQAEYAWYLKVKGALRDLASDESGAVRCAVAALQQQLTPLDRTIGALTASAKLLRSATRRVLVRRMSSF